MAQGSNRCPELMPIKVIIMPVMLSSHARFDRDGTRLARVERERYPILSSIAGSPGTGFSSSIFDLSFLAMRWRRSFSFTFNVSRYSFAFSGVGLLGGGRALTISWNWPSGRTVE